MPTTERQAEPRAVEPGRAFTLDFPLTLQAVVTPEDGGGFSAEVPSMPGCVTEADTVEELRANLREAAEGWAAVRAEVRQGGPDRPASAG